MGCPDTHGGYQIQMAFRVFLVLILILLSFGDVI